MTLQQLKFIITVADKGSLNEAAKSLFISQPSLSNAVKEVEEELKFVIFIRTNKGVYPTADGSEFLGYARQVIQQTELLEEKFLSRKPKKQKFSVSTHHYLFAANAFVELIKQFGGDEYEFTYRETKTYEVIEDVKNLRSEMGLLYLNDFNEPVIRKILQESNLVFTPLFTASPHVFVYKKHPLAKKEQIQLQDLEDYPCINFEQGQHNSFYFSEEILSTRTVKKSIKVSDRAAVVNFMIGVNGYTICTGVFPEYLHGEDICSIPLKVNEKIRVGTIMHKDAALSRMGKIYLSALQNIALDIDKSYNRP